MSDSESELREENLNTSQTQPEVKKQISDIFGDSSDEDDDTAGKWTRVAVKANASTLPTTAVSGEQAKFAADIFADTDSDSDAVEKRESSSLSRLKKSGKSTGTKKVDNTGSDTRRDADTKKRKRGGKSKHEENNKFRHKRNSKTDTKSASSSQKELGQDSSSSDSYDSEGEVERTKADDDFIDNDGDDENEDYAGPQNFDDDERAEPRRKEHKGADKIKKVFTDPVSETIDSMKKKKHIELTDPQKQILCENLYKDMMEAYDKDVMCRSRNQPAVAKLNLLPRVQQIVRMKEAQHSLLEGQILDAFNKWIEPHERVLSSFTVRRAIYEIIKSLPCKSDHIINSGIGKTIVALRKHPDETEENKRRLRELMEKWSRSSFGLSADPRGRSVSEVSDVGHLRSQARLHRDVTAEGASSFGDAVAVSNQVTKDAFDRVQAPRSNGYMFTVSSQAVNESQALKTSTSANSSYKQGIEKKMKSMHALSKKKAFGAIDVCLNGRNKA